MVASIVPGKRADLTVFRLAEKERREEHKVTDVPDGARGRRWPRDPAPVRLTLVEGPTFQDGEATGTRPGRMLSPGPGRP